MTIAVALASEIMLQPKLACSAIIENIFVQSGIEADALARLRTALGEGSCDIYFGKPGQPKTIELDPNPDDPFGPIAQFLVDQAKIQRCYNRELTIMLRENNEVFTFKGLRIKFEEEDRPSVLDILDLCSDAEELHELINKQERCIPQKNHLYIKANDYDDYQRIHNALWSRDSGLELDTLRNLYELHFGMHIGSFDPVNPEIENLSDDTTYEIEIKWK